MTSWRMYSFVHSAFLCCSLGGRSVAVIMGVSYSRYHQGLPDVEVEIVQLILHCVHALDCNIALPAERALPVQKDAKRCKTLQDVSLLLAPTLTAVSPALFEDV